VGIERISDAWPRADGRLGYRRFGAQGSDWGTSIAMSHRSTATRSGRRHPSHAAARTPDPATLDDLTGAERAALATLREADEMGLRILGAAVDPAADGRLRLVDSPAALCAWIVEKFWSWTDSGGDLHRVITRDELLEQPDAATGCPAPVPHPPGCTGKASGRSTNGSPGRPARR